MILIVIGVLIILAVVAVNWWQERRFHKEVESNFSTLQRDALLDDPNLDMGEVVDEPQFDTTSLHDTLHNADNDYAYEKSSSDAEFSLDINAIDTNSIDEDYSRLATNMAKGATKYDVDNQADNTTAANLNIKPAQHDDIKAIFNDAFSYVNKANAKPEADMRKVDFQEYGSQATTVTNETPKSDAEEFNSVDSILIDDELSEPEVNLPATLHAQIDLTAILYLAEETPSNTLISTLTSLLHGYDKPVFVHMLASNKEWYLLNDAKTSQLVSPNQLISRVACSIQLADRTGAVSRSMLNRFQLAVESAGLDINAHVEWQGAGDALAKATALDTFCIEVDKTIGFHLVHGESGAFTGTKLRGLAEAQGLTLTSDGVFQHFDEPTNIQTRSKQGSFVMFNRDDHPFSPEMLRSSVVKGITFQFDIPHVKQCGEVFTQMVQVARQMEIGLNAVLVDDNNRLLGDIQIEKIRQQLKILHATMLVRGIIPGTDSALRLFS